MCKVKTTETEVKSDFVHRLLCAVAHSNSATLSGGSWIQGQQPPLLSIFSSLGLHEQSLGLMTH